MECITVYHGTTITNCKSILEERKFKCSVASESFQRSIISKKIHIIG